jgi:hypothetical protein
MVDAERPCKYAVACRGAEALPCGLKKMPGVRKERGRMGRSNESKGLMAGAMTPWKPSRYVASKRWHEFDMSNGHYSSRICTTTSSTAFPRISKHGQPTRRCTAGTHSPHQIISGLSADCRKVSVDVGHRLSPGKGMYRDSTRVRETPRRPAIRPDGPQNSNKTYSRRHVRPQLSIPMGSPYSTNGQCSSNHARNVEVSGQRTP